MGITTISPNDEDRRISALRNAHLFKPSADLMLEASQEIVLELPVMEEPGPANKLAGLLAGARVRLKEVLEHSKGHSAVLKPFGIVEQARYCINLATSIITACDTLQGTTLQNERSIIVDALKKLCNDIDIVVGVTNALVTPPKLPKDEPVDPMPAEEIDQLFDATGLEQFANYSLLLPKDSTDLVRVEELPVMVTFNRFVTVEELEGRGFSTIGVSGYIVMREAHFVAINTKVCAEKGLDEAKVLSMSMQKMESKLGTLSLLRETGVPSNTGPWMLYWFGTKSFVNALRGVDQDNPLIVTDFQFPFGDYVKANRHVKRDVSERSDDAVTMHEVAEEEKV